MKTFLNEIKNKILRIILHKKNIRIISFISIIASLYIFISLDNSFSSNNINLPFLTEEKKNLRNLELISNNTINESYKLNNNSNEVDNSTYINLIGNNNNNSLINNSIKINNSNDELDIVFNKRRLINYSILLHFKIT